MVANMSYKFFNWDGSIMTDQECEDLIKHCNKTKSSYADIHLHDGRRFVLIQSTFHEISFVVGGGIGGGISVKNCSNNDSIGVAKK